LHHCARPRPPGENRRPDADRMSVVNGRTAP
jgi:hypothetical protein